MLRQWRIWWLTALIIFESGLKNRKGLNRFVQSCLWHWGKHSLRKRKATLLLSHQVIKNSGGNKIKRYYLRRRDQRKVDRYKNLNKWKCIPQRKVLIHDFEIISERYQDKTCTQFPCQELMPDQCFCRRLLKSFDKGLATHYTQTKGPTRHEKTRWFYDIYNGVVKKCKLWETEKNERVETKKCKYGHIAKRMIKTKSRYHRQAEHKKWWFSVVSKWEFERVRNSTSKASTVIGVYCLVHW